MSGDFLETSRPVLAWVLRTTWEASLIAALVLVAQYLLRGRVSARWRYNLWLLVVARLVLPAVPGHRASPFNLVQLPAAAVEQRVMPAHPSSIRSRQPSYTPPRTTVPVSPAPGIRPPGAPSPGAGRRTADNLSLVSNKQAASEPAHRSDARTTGADESVPSTQGGAGFASEIAAIEPARHPTGGPIGLVAGVVEAQAPPPGDPIVAPTERSSAQPAAVEPVGTWSVRRPPVFSAAPQSGTIPVASRTPWYRLVNWYAVVAIAWVAGAGFVASRLAWVSLRLGLTVRRLRPVTDPGLISLMHECARQLGMARTPQLLHAPDAFGPALVGLLRPRVVLPECVIGGECGNRSESAAARPPFHRHEVRLILMHELAHMKRWDVAANWLLAGLGALHWFNPVLWLAFRRMRTDRELACDEMVLSAADPRAGSAYGPTILKLLQTLSHGRQPMPGVGMVGVLEGITRFTNPKSSLRRRIAMIARFDSQQARHRGASFFGITLSVLATGVALTGAVKGQQADGRRAAVAGKTELAAPPAAGNTPPALSAADDDAERNAAAASGEAQASATQALDEARQQVDAARQQIDEARQTADDHERESQNAAAETERAVSEATRAAAAQEEQSQQAVEQAKQAVAEAKDSAQRQREEAEQALERAKQEVAEAGERAKAEAADAEAANPGSKDTGTDSNDTDVDADAAGREQIATAEQAVREAAAQGDEAIHQAEQQVREAVAQQQQAIQEAHAAVEQATAEHQATLQGTVDAAQEVAVAQQSAQQELVAAQAALQAAQQAYDGALQPAAPAAGAPTAGGPAAPPTVNPASEDSPPPTDPPATDPSSPDAQPPVAPPAGEVAAPRGGAPVAPLPSTAAPDPSAPRPIRALPATAAPAPVAPAESAPPTTPPSVDPLSAPSPEIAGPASQSIPPDAPDAGAAPGAAPVAAPSALPPATPAPRHAARGRGYGGMMGGVPAAGTTGPGGSGMFPGMGGYPATTGAPGTPAIPGFPGMGGMPMLGGGGNGVATGRVEDQASRAADARTAGNLQKPMPVQLDGVGLADALEYVADKSGVDIVTDWKALEAAGVNRDSQVTLHLRQNVPAEQVLTWVLRSAAGDAAGFAVDRGVVVVSGRAQLERMVVTRVYDIRPMDPAGGALEELVRETISPGAWRQSGGNGSVRVFNNRLFVTTTEPNHREVERLLGLMKAQGMDQSGNIPKQPGPNGNPSGYGGGYPGSGYGTAGGGYPGYPAYGGRGYGSPGGAKAPEPAPGRQ